MQQIASVPQQMRPGGFVPDPRISPAMGPMPNSSFPQTIASHMDFLRKNQQLKGERYEEGQPYKREKDGQEVKLMRQKFLDAKAKKAELQQQNGTKKSSQSSAATHESNFSFGSKPQKNHSDSSGSEASAPRKRPLSNDDYWSSDESRADGSFQQSFGGAKVPRMESNANGQDVKRSYSESGEPQMSNGSTVSVEIRQEITYPGMPTGGIHRVNTSVTLRQNGADATVHTNTTATNFRNDNNAGSRPAGSETSAEQPQAQQQPTASHTAAMPPQTSDDLFGDFDLSNDDFKDFLNAFPSDFQDGFPLSAEELEQLDCAIMASTSSSSHLRMDGSNYSLSSVNNQQLMMDTTGGQVKMNANQSSQFTASQQNGSRPDNQTNTNSNGFNQNTTNDSSSASVALRSLADQNNRNCGNQPSEQPPDPNQQHSYNSYGVKCEGSPYSRDMMGQVRMGPLPSYQEVVPPRQGIAATQGFKLEPPEANGNAVVNSPEMMGYQTGERQAPYGQNGSNGIVNSGLNTNNYRAVTPPANMAASLSGNNMEPSDSLSALQMSLKKRSTLLGLNGTNSTRPTGGPFQQTMTNAAPTGPGDMRQQMQMANVRPQLQQQQLQQQQLHQMGQYNQRNLATPLNISAPSQMFPANSEFGGGQQQQMMMSSKQQMLLQCGNFPPGMQRPDQRFMGDGQQMYMQTEQQQTLMIQQQQGVKMAGPSGVAQPHMFPQEIPVNMGPSQQRQQQQQFVGFPDQQRGNMIGNNMRPGGMMPQVVVSDPFSSMPSNPQQQRFAAAQHPQFVQSTPSMFTKSGTIGEEMKMFTSAPTKKGGRGVNATGRVIPPNVSVVAQPTMDNFRFGGGGVPPDGVGRPMFFEVDGQMVRQGGGGMGQDQMGSYAPYDGRPMSMAQQQQQHQMMQQQQSQRHLEFVQSQSGGPQGQRGMNFLQMEQSQQAAMRYAGADRQMAMQQQQQQQFSHVGGPGMSQAQMEMQMRSSASMQMTGGPNPNMRGNSFPTGPGGNGRQKPPGPPNMVDSNMYGGGYM